MKITFDITDCTTLCGERQQNIEVIDLNCPSDSMEFAAKLTEHVKKFTHDYINQKGELK